MFAIVRAHPEYGGRRVQTELRERGYRVNHKVVERLLSCWELSLIQRVRKPRRSALHTLLQEAGAQMNLVASLREEEIEEFDVLYTDFTELVYGEGRRKAQLMPLLDHRSTLVVGHALGERKDTEVALEAWRKAQETLRRRGRGVEGMIVHHDQDGVYLGHRWVYELVIKNRVRVSYSEKGAKGNVQMESFNGRFKEENRMLFLEQEDFESLRKVVEKRIRYYNRVRRHSALGNKAPMVYLRERGGN